MADELIDNRNSLHTARCETMDLLDHAHLRRKHDLIKQVLENQKDMMYALETILLNMTRELPSCKPT